MKRYKPNNPTALLSAFALLALTGSPLHAQATDSTPHPAADAEQDKAIRLNPFEVNASSNAGYGATATSSASRVAQAYIDVPQTVNVVTSDYIDDLNIIDERALLQTVPNVMLGFDTNNTRIIRASQVNATYVDGITQLNTTQAPPILFYDRVEIVKGPSSSGFGVGEPGGIINYISKVPTGINRTTVEFGIGDYSNYKFNLDTQGVAPTNSKLSYRLDAFWDKGDYAIPVWYHRGAGAQLALKYDLNPDTTIQLITAYSDILTPADTDLSAIWKQSTLYTVWRTLTGDSYAALPNTPHNPGNSVQNWAKGATLMPTDFNPNPPWGGYDDQVFTQLMIVDHNFNEHFHIRNTAEISTSDYIYRMSQISSLQSNPAGYAPGLYTDIARNYQEHNGHSFTDDIDFLANFDLGKFAKSTTLLGAVYSQFGSSDLQYQPAEVDTAGHPILASLANPSRAVMGDPPSQRLYTSNSTGRAFSDGWYVQEDLSLFADRLILSAGWRNDYEDFYNRNFLNQSSGDTGGWKNNRGVPRYSITIKPVKWLSFYELYSQHVDPVQSTNQYFIVLGKPTPAQYAKYGNFATTENFNPGGTLVESGMKGTFLDGKLTVTFDFFHEINTGQVFGRVVEQNYDPTTGAQTVQIGTNLISGVNAHGYEWQIFGQPTPRLSFTLGYGQTKGHYPNFADGMPHWWAQPPSMSGEAKYDFGDLHGNGFYATFGGQYYWGYWNYEDPYTWQRAGQYQLNGGVGYKWDHGHQSIYLNDNNFTNQLVVVGNEDNVPWTSLPLEQGYITYKYTF